MILDFSKKKNKYETCNCYEVIDSDKSCNNSKKIHKLKKIINLNILNEYSKKKKL